MAVAPMRSRLALARSSPGSGRPRVGLAALRAAERAARRYAVVRNGSPWWRELCVLAIHYGQRDQNTQRREQHPFAVARCCRSGGDRAEQKAEP